MYSIFFIVQLKFYLEDFLEDNSFKRFLLNKFDSIFVEEDIDEYKFYKI